MRKNDFYYFINLKFLLFFSKKYIQKNLYINQFLSIIKILWEGKQKIFKRLNESYNKYKSSYSSRLELERKIDGDFSAEENQYKDEANIKLYYLEEKRKILDDYYDAQLKEAKKKETELNEKLIKNMLEQQKALQELKNKPAKNNNKDKKSKMRLYKI